MRLLFLLFYCLCFPDNNLFIALEIAKLAFTLCCLFSNFLVYVMKAFVSEG